jgi:hypothetical protein
MKKHFALLSVCVASALFVCNLSATDAKGLPHAGTPVAVGSHGYHLELVRDAEKGRLQAYVLDGHAEKYVDVTEPSFELVATIGAKEERLKLVRTPAAGKPLSQASRLFEGTAEWVKTATNFNAVIPTITLQGKTYKDVKVTFPKGSIHRGH